MITQEQLKDLVSYDMETGIFKWIKRTSNRITIGEIAGHSNKTGYITIRIHGILYLAHRLAWLYCHGDFPNMDIDHINMKKSDNRISNLRLATRAQNIANTKLRKSNNHGFKGVSFDKSIGKWFSRARDNYKVLYLGAYETKEDAALAYKNYSSNKYKEFYRDT